MNIKTFSSVIGYHCYSNISVRIYVSMTNDPVSNHHSIFNMLILSINYITTMSYI